MIVKKQNYTLRYKADSEVELILPYENILVNKPLVNHSLVNKPLINTNRLSILVWNIFKQKKVNWLHILENYAEQAELMLLQEAQNTVSLLNFVTRHNKIADQVPAYSYNKVSVGVMTISNALPLYVLPFKKREPLIGVPKSALITLYHIEQLDKNLLVANLHAVNFTFGVKIYHQQIQMLLNKIKNHEGPVILAGDFNAWSQQRLYLLYQLIHKIGLRPVNFSVDVRKTFMGRPLDFVFYKGLQPDVAQIIDTDSSDHNPLFVQFKIN